MIFDYKHAEITGDNINDDIYLVGNRAQDELVIKNINLVIRDGKTNDNYSINFKYNTGYNPQLFIGHFITSNSNEILISIDSGSTGLERFFYIYSFLNNIERKLFDFEEFNNQSKYEVIYQDNYIVSIKGIKNFTIDLRNKNPDYINTLYYPNGKLKNPTFGMVSPIIDLNIIPTNINDVYKLSAIQRIIGYYNADILGEIVTGLYFNGTRFVILPDTITMHVF